MIWIQCLFFALLGVFFGVEAQQGALAFTTVLTTVQAGESYVIGWTGGDSSPVSLTLVQGPGISLENVGTLTTSATGGSYVWNVPTSLASADDYGLMISQGAVINYSRQFSITGGSAGSNTTPTTRTSSAPRTTTASTQAASGSASTLAGSNSQSGASAASSRSGTELGASQTSAIQTPDPTASTTATSSTSGLSTGAKSGIGIGAALGIVLLAVAAFLLGRHGSRLQNPFAFRSPLKRNHADVYHGNDDFDTEIPEVETKANRSELPAYREPKKPYELP